MPAILTLQQIINALDSLDEDELVELRDVIDDQLGEEEIDELDEDEDEPE